MRSSASPEGEEVTLTDSILDFQTRRKEKWPEDASCVCYQLGRHGSCVAEVALLANATTDTGLGDDDRRGLDLHDFGLTDF